MQLRSTATTSSWQGEIKGAAAAGGKIGGGGVNYYMEAILKQSIGFDMVYMANLFPLGLILLLYKFISLLI